MNKIDKTESVLQQIESNDLSDLIIDADDAMRLSDEHKSIIKSASIRKYKNLPKDSPLLVMLSEFNKNIVKIALSPQVTRGVVVTLERTESSESLANEFVSDMRNLGYAICDLGEDDPSYIELVATYVIS